MIPLKSQHSSEVYTTVSLLGSVHNGGYTLSKCRLKIAMPKVTSYM